MDAGIVAVAAVNIALLTVVLIQLAKVSRQVEASDAALADVRKLQELAYEQADEQARAGAGMARTQAHLRGSLRTLSARTDALLDRQRGLEAGIQRLEDKFAPVAAVCTAIWNRQSALVATPPSTPPSTSQRSSDGGYQTRDTLEQSLNVRAAPTTPTASAARGERRAPSDPGGGTQPPTPIRSPMSRTAPGGAGAPRTSAAAASRDADGPSSKSAFEAQRQLGQVARTSSASAGYEYLGKDGQAGLIERDTSRHAHSSNGRPAATTSLRAGERSGVVRRPATSEVAMAEGVDSSPRNVMKEVRKVGSWTAGQLGTALHTPVQLRMPSSPPSVSSGNRFYAHAVESQEVPREREIRKALHAVGSQSSGSGGRQERQPRAQDPKTY